MEQVADGVRRIALPPRSGVNAYLVGDVLVDAGYPFAAKRLLQELQGHAVRVHALTHGHVDHAGGSKRVCQELDVPLWCPAADVEAVRRGHADAKLGPFGAVLTRVNAWPGARPIARWAKATTWRASTCSRRRATRPATSRSGARPTAC